MPINTAAGVRFYFARRLTHVSARQGDHGYKVWMALGDQRHDVVVKLDGRVIQNPIAADARAGYVDFIVERDGNLVVNKFDDGAVVHRGCGRVEITVPLGSLDTQGNLE